MPDPDAPRRTLPMRVIALAAVGGITLATATAVWALPDRGARPTVTDLASSQSADDDPPGDDRGVDSTSSTFDDQGVDPSTGSTTATTGAPPTTTVATTGPTAPGVVDPAATATVPVAEAGTVTFAVDGGQVVVVSIAPAAGWTPTVEVAAGREIEVSFVSSSGRVDLHVELDDGVLKVRIRDRRTDVETETVMAIPGQSATTPPTTSAPTTGSTAGPDSTTTPPTTTPPPATTSPATDGTRTWNLAGGTVTVRLSGGSLTLVGATPTAGWSVETNHGGGGGDEVEVRFRNGDRESRLRVELEDGGLRERVEER